MRPAASYRSYFRRDDGRGSGGGGSGGSAKDLELAEVKQPGRDPFSSAATGQRTSGSSIRVEARGPPPAADGVDADDRGRYASALILLARVLLSILDHLTDLLVLLDLWRRDRAALAAVGAALDLLPGPVTAAQFLRLGHPWWKCGLLLFHPANFYVHSAISRCCPDASSFSRQVAQYARECQGLLESPMQLIFTMTLITLRILPTPFDPTEAPVLKNSFGGEIHLSFLPATSVVLSLAMIVTNAFLNSIATLSDDSSSSDSSSDSKSSRVWNLVCLCSFTTCTVLFRIHAWVFLCTFLAEFSLGIIAALVVINVAAIVGLSSLDGIEPVTCGLYSTTFPTIRFQSTATYATNNDGDSLRRRRKVVCVLSWGGTLLLAASCWGVYLAVHVFLWPGYSPAVRIRRSEVIHHVWTLTLSGVSALLTSRLLLSAGASRDDDDGEGRAESPPRRKKSLSVVVTDASPPWVRRLSSATALPACCGLALALASVAAHVFLAFHGPRGEFPFVVAIEEACTHRLGDSSLTGPIELEGYGWNFPPGGNRTMSPVYRTATFNKTLAPVGWTFLGELGGYPLLEDRLPASSLPAELQDSPLLLVLPGQKVEDLKAFVDDYCLVSGKENTFIIDDSFCGKTPSGAKSQGWMASIGHRNGGDGSRSWVHLCDAAIVDRGAAVTSASCHQRALEATGSVLISLSVESGTVLTSVGLEGQHPSYYFEPEASWRRHAGTDQDYWELEVDPERAWVVPWDYDPSEAYFDVAVIRLPARVPHYGSAFFPLCLPSVPSVEPADLDGKLVTTADGSHLMVFPNSYCNRKYLTSPFSWNANVSEALPDLLPSHMLCAGSVEEKDGSCDNSMSAGGDGGVVGGPLTLFDPETERRVLVGVAAGTRSTPRLLFRQCRPDRGGDSDDNDDDDDEEADGGLRFGVFARVDHKEVHRFILSEVSLGTPLLSGAPSAVVAATAAEMTVLALATAFCQLRLAPVTATQ